MLLDFFRTIPVLLLKTSSRHAQGPHALFRCIAMDSATGLPLCGHGYGNYSSATAQSKFSLYPNYHQSSQTSAFPVPYQSANPSVYQSYHQPPGYYSTTSNHNSSKSHHLSPPSGPFWPNPYNFDHNESFQNSPFGGGNSNAVTAAGTSHYPHVTVPHHNSVSSYDETVTPYGHLAHSIPPAHHTHEPSAYSSKQHVRASEHPVISGDLYATQPAAMLNSSRCNYSSRSPPEVTQKSITPPEAIKVQCIPQENGAEEEDEQSISDNDNEGEFLIKTEEKQNPNEQNNAPNVHPVIYPWMKKAYTGGEWI